MQALLFTVKPENDYRKVNPQQHIKSLDYFSTVPFEIELLLYSTSTHNLLFLHGSLHWK